MKTKIIATANQKGGVGKTTTVINLGAELARRKKVLIIDLDPQGNCSKTLTAQRTFPFEETIAAMFDRPKVVSIADLIRPALVHNSQIENLDLVPADFQLSRIIETSLTKINRERILEKQLAKLEGIYDFVILDTPPNLSLTTLNAIQASDLILIPVDSGAFSLDGISPLLDAVSEIKDEDAHYLILRNEVDSRNSIINEFIDEELEVAQDRVLPVSIRKSEHVGQANAVSAPVRFYKSGSLVNNDYRQLALFINDM
ncbi:ParA family protein [Vibrio vulnificus]|uniref:ParA family protein n=1 Tax=Vibrio vulnificus TaxID=672 RepID=UPI0007EE3B86|nr:ParA family protein [Vibrio vulnificus]ANN29694.1 Chromosome partitioning protein ParA / Sporulation initiation inhibitor protein Soj [Vibrio vulnificus]EGR0791224.1 ParA family protein [Vibrio vulnificus]EGR0799765.1 ParA family protein [Vibrio vulnificus]EGR0817018.1 ParA family protein [Vibrio vulnificus]EGR0879909.1 ParA family protein [Vibrio vulnificus]